ncbi:platelet glycoprotein Ib alpha chain [Antechinus flavipes]|uniref:platelet glycoprotein Ib alpha chain n=1 Tax=Antechinus flavipes TaxID=38775 RepID=UPI00223608D7|nr:platelet glycoprotein Ib alpha chain [Antechinus flavipes]
MNWRCLWKMDPVLLLVLLFLLLLGPSYSQSPCETQKGASKMETNCESLGLKSIPPKLSPDTAILFLQNNGLKSFSTSSLGFLTQLTELYIAKNNMSVLIADGKLPLLSILDLSDNCLKTLPSLAHSLPSLTSLDLSRNALESLSPHALAGLDSLENLYLGGNKLRSLPPDFLKAAFKLQKLDLSKNRLEYLSADLLADLQNLNTLFLQDNQLSILPFGFFRDHLLPYVFLHSNPWNCNCELRYLRHWLQENQGNVYLWKEGVDVKVMTPDVKSVLCEVPFKTPVVSFSANCPITGDEDYDSYNEYDEVTAQGVLKSETTTIPTTISLEHSTVLSRSKLTTTELTTFPITPEKNTFPTTRRSIIFLNSPKITGLPTISELTRFLNSEATTFHITPENTILPTTQEVIIFLNSSQSTTQFPTMPKLTRFLISSEATTLQITPEPTAFSENLETTRFQTSPENTTFPVTSETTMLQITSESVTFPIIDSIGGPMSVTPPSLFSTLILLRSNILPPNEAVALGNLGDPSNSSSPISTSCCLLSLRFYIFGTAWVLVSSIVLILFLVLAQPPLHLLRTHTFMEDIPNPRATVHLELPKGKEVIVHRAWLLFLGGSIPSFRTRLFLWVQSNGRVGPLTLKRKPSAISLGRGEDLLGSVNIRYSGHSL